MYVNGNFSLCTPLVSHICHAGAVANVDFKLCRSSWDDHTTSWKVQTSISEAKIVRIGAESLKIFPSRPQKWANGLSFFALEGKNRAADSNFGEKTASRSRSFETAVSSLDFVYRKLRQIPEHPPPQKKKKKKKTTKLAKWTTETRQGEFMYLILFKKITFYFIERFYPSLSL